MYEWISGDYFGIMRCARSGPQRLTQLDARIPGSSLQSIRQALITAAELGLEVWVCAALRTINGWPWRDALADRILLVLKPAE